MRRGLVVAVVLASVAGAALGPGVAAGAVIGNPVLSASIADNTVEPGEDGRLSVSLSNAGEITAGSSRNPGAEQRVMTARGTTARLSAPDAPLTVETDTVALGALADGGLREVPFAVSVAENAEPGTYTVELTVEYTYTNTIGELAQEVQNERTVEETFELDLTVRRAARFEVVDVSSGVSAGERGRVAVTYRNTGSAPAREATATVRSSNAGLTFGGAPSAESYLGTVRAGEEVTVEQTASLAAGSADRSFALRSTLAYEDRDGVTRREELVAGMRPGGEGSFAVAGTDSSVAVGDTGSVTLSVTNTGENALEDATVTVESSNAALTFGGAPTARTYVGSWEAGETKSVTVEASVAPGAERRAYAVDATVAYENGADLAVRSETLTAGVTPAAEQSFALDGVSVALRAGEDGSLSGTLANEGPGAAENAVLVLQPVGPNVDVGESEFALGDVAAGESVDFEYDLDASSAAADGPRQFTLQVRYQDGDGTTRRSDPLYARGTVEPERDRFTVEPVAAEFAPGDSGRLELRVTNNGDEPVSAVSAKLFADDPVSAGDDEAFVDELEPGESRVVVFEAGVAGSALTGKSYPVSVDFQYDTADGETELSRTYRVPVAVAESEEQSSGLFGGLALGGVPPGATVPLLGAAGVVLLGLVLGGRRR